MKDACKLARGLPRPSARVGTASRVTTPQPVVAQDAVIFNEPGRRSRCRAGRRRGLIAEGSRGAGYGNGAALKIMALVQSTGFASFMPAVRRAKVELREFNSPAQSRQREAVCADSSVLALAIRRSVGQSATGFQGSQRRPARRLMDEVSAYCRFCRFWE
jgi:hypothetical protein